MYFIDHRFFFFLLICLPWVSLGQSEFEFLAEPQFGVGYKVSSTYSHKFSASQRLFIYRDAQWELRSRQTDLTHISQLQLKDNLVAGFGVQYRFGTVYPEGTANEVRFFQQINILKKQGALKFDHRIRLDQRIRNGGLTHRFRYRFTLDTPLNGERLDVGEAYITGHLEPLLSVSNATKPAYDIRVSGLLGFLVAPGQKFQIGLQFRQEDFSQSSESLLFLNSSFFISL